VLVNRNVLGKWLILSLTHTHSSLCYRLLSRRQMRKVCNHPYLFLNGDFMIDENIVRASGKFELLNRMLPKLKAAGHRYVHLVHLRMSTRGAHLWLNSCARTDFGQTRTESHRRHHHHHHHQMLESGGHVTLDPPLLLWMCCCTEYSCSRS
jgi:hypothetical protein